MSRVGHRAHRGGAIRLGPVNVPDPDVLVPTVLATVGEARETWDCRPCQEHVRAIVELIVAAVCADPDSTTGDSVRTGVPLTTREREVLRQLSTGLTARQIARRLGITSATVRKHLEHAYSKLGVHDRLTATIRVRELSLLPEWWPSISGLEPPDQGVIRRRGTRMVSVPTKRRQMTAQEPPVTDRQAVALDVLKDWFAAWNAHDLGGIAELMTQDVVYEEPAAPGGGYRGHAQVLVPAAAIFRASPDFRLDLLEAWATRDGGVVAGWYRATGTVTGAWHPPGLAPTNGPVEFCGMDRNEIRDGRIARHQTYYDLSQVARQLGALPQPGSLGARLAVRLQHLSAGRLRRRARHDAGGGSGTQTGSRSDTPPQKGTAS